MLFSLYWYNCPGNLKIVASTSFLKNNIPIKAPIKKGQEIANLVITNKDKIIKTLPLYASEKVPKVNFFKSLLTSLNYLIWGDV